MSSGLNANNSTIVSAFRTALAHQGLIVLVILAIVALAWQALRVSELRRASASGSSAAVTPVAPEAPARRLLRIAFGLLWILDGILQAQPQMPLGMTTGVIEPAASTSPSWVQHVANAGATIWSYHPIEAPASAVWIQVGIGLFLIVAPRGAWSRLAGAAALGWGLVVWVFGEAFGQIFAPGGTILFGIPGAVLFYALAGGLVALPERVFASKRLGQLLCAGMGLFLLGMALLQAWPGRGFWQGHLAGHRAALGPVASMAQQMSATSQPTFLSRLVADFGSFDAAHGFAVNLFFVVVLVALGAAFLSARPALVRPALAVATVVFLAVWVFIQDLGFLGGVGTDPNSMVPMLLILYSGYVALTRVPAPVLELGDARPSVFAGLRERLVGWRAALAARPSYLGRTVSALGALGIVLIGVVPMGLASLSPNADPIIAAATDGTPDYTSFPASAFTLTDQKGATVSLASLRGRTIALTFLDPVCTNDCPLIAQEFRQADQMLGASAKHVVFVAVDANPLYRSRAYLLAFDRQERMDTLSNWLYLTGSLVALRRVWSAYGVQVAYSPGGAMIAHSELAYVIDSRGVVRTALDSDPGPGTEASRSSFAVTLTTAINRALR